MAPAQLSAAVGFALATTALATTPEFERWASAYQRRYYSHDDYARAVGNFLKNTEILASLSDADGLATYGHGPFSDVSPEDFKRARFPGQMDASEGTKGGAAPHYLPGSPLDSVDWRSQGAVTDVKDQSVCGSCWAESAVGNMESMWYLANKATMKAPIQLSVQEVIECDPYDYACYGGYPKGAYQYVIKHGGISAETDYPYNVDGKVICLANQTFNETCGDGMCDDPPLTNYCDQTCSDKAQKSVAKINSWVALTTGEDAMAAYVAQHGPISIGLDASGGALGVLFPWLQFYKSGVANPSRCTTRVDHGVLIVGYGIEGTTPYWIIKNSWGQKWGESGYFRLIRGGAKCGITTMATSAVITATPLITV